MPLNLNLKDGLLASDTETTGLSPWGRFEDLGYHPARPFAFSFCDSSGNTAYIRWEVDPFTRKVKICSKDYAILKEIYSNPKLTHIGHNFSFDRRMLESIGIKITGKIHDTLIMGHIVTGGSELAYGLKPLGEKYLGISTKDEKDLKEATNRARREGKKLGWKLAEKGPFGKDPTKADYWMAPKEICEKYAVQDSFRAMLFYKLWYPEILKNANLLRVYEREMRLTKVVKGMEDRGVRLFYPELKRLTKEYEKYSDDRIKEADTCGGKGLNFRSPKQMNQKFYVEKKCKPKYNDRGNYMLDGKKLVELAAVDPLARIILDFRGANHMLSSFMRPYDRFKSRDEDGEWILHASFKQVGPVTGRFACGDPNLMCVASEDTIRNKTRVEYKPKRVLGPRKEHWWYLPDYKQIEVWVFAFIAQEMGMMQPLMEGYDFHGAVSKTVWGHEPDYQEKYDSYRKRAKLILFCKLYGGGVKKIASLLEIYKDDKGDLDIPKAQKFLDDYDAKFPGVSKFQKRMMAKVERERVIYNPFGRMYSIDPEHSYKGVNYVIQGTCADIMKCAMINVYNLFQTKWKGCHILITLHDELICEIPNRYHSKRLMRDLIEAMQGDFHTVLGIPKPLPVSMEITKGTWADSKEVKL